MSTRYVWDRHFIKDIYGLSKSLTTKYTYTLNADTLSADIVGSQGDYYKIVNGEFYVYEKSDFSSPGRLLAFSDSGYDYLYYKYMIPLYNGIQYNQPSEVMLSPPDNLPADYAVYFTRSGNTISAVCTYYTEDYTKPNKQFYVIRAVVESQEMGDFAGNSSSKNSNTYNNDGITGNYWYVYKGSDNIDPSDVRYSRNDEIYSGDSVTVAVTPRTPTYGGTIYYRYQYSINGGSTWANIGSRTTATSATVTIPEGAEQFQARVLASDGWGFTSSTYVYGPAKEVSQLKAYVGVNAKAGSLKKGYVGVTKIARSLAKGYVGVGGVAKKLF